MCGIWFYVQPIGYQNQSELETISREIEKRGPDKTISKYFTFGQFEFHLTFYRLAIMDLSELGDQPFNYEQNDEQIYLMCNGEIYGFENLVREFHLENLLKSHSDCEILIHLYKRLGLEGLYNILTCRNDVSGEFAIVVVHIKNGVCEIHYMRDFCGKRPLYFAEYENSLCLTSQLCGIPYKENGFKKSAQIRA